MADKKTAKKKGPTKRATSPGQKRKEAEALANGVRLLEAREVDAVVRENKLERAEARLKKAREDARERDERAAAVRAKDRDKVYEREVAVKKREEALKAGERDQAAGEALRRVGQALAEGAISGEGEDDDRRGTWGMHPMWWMMGRPR